jgi:hypothetical protein
MQNSRPITALMGSLFQTIARLAMRFEPRTLEQRG